MILFNFVIESVNTYNSRALLGNPEERSQLPVGYLHINGGGASISGRVLVTRIQMNKGNTARSSGFPPNPVVPPGGETTGFGENDGAGAARMTACCCHPNHLNPNLL